MKNMITDIKQDCLLGRNIQKIEPITSTTIEYYEDTVGNVKVTLFINELIIGDFEDIFSQDYKHLRGKRLTFW